jgi:hypothetical protein
MRAKRICPVCEVGKIKKASKSLWLCYEVDCSSMVSLSSGGTVYAASYWLNTFKFSLSSDNTVSVSENNVNVRVLPGVAPNRLRELARSYMRLQVMS